MPVCPTIGRNLGARATRREIKEGGEGRWKEGDEGRGEGRKEGHGGSRWRKKVKEGKKEERNRQ
jgi:hypothetical protein